MRKFLIGVGIVLLVIAVMIFALRMFTPEDTWICSSGAWIRHGNPDMGMPTTPCSND